MAEPSQIAFFLDFARGALSGAVDPRDPTACKRLADEVRARVQGSSGARHVLLHLLFPELFERIGSETNKRQIVEAFPDLADGATDLDDALANIRGGLPRRLGRQDFDFYDEDIRRHWSTENEPTQEPGVVGEGPQPRCWVEKTHVRGRRHRQEGEYRLGEALWSPQRDRGGGDSYRFMREVQPGDIILHLTDGAAFTGVSRAAGVVEEFGGVANSEWEQGPSYLVRLRRYTQLDPPLSRDVFFADPYGARLFALIQGGTNHLFYSRGLTLNQGAYLTPAPPELVAILDDAYRELTGHTMTGLLGFEPPPEPPTAERVLLVGASTDAEEHAARHARQIAAQGSSADWWSFPLNEEREEAIKALPYLYIYSGQPLQQLTQRFRIAEYKTSTGDQGMPCPWPDFVEERYRDKTSAGPRKSEIFKTWLLVDNVETLERPIGLDELEKPDGTPADPSALVGGFALWRPRTLVPTSRLGQLAQLTNFEGAELLELESLLRQKKQIILEGPPGSGKTYIAELFGRYITGNPLRGDHDERLVIVQFHQSYGYEDFVQGIRPETNDAGQLEYHVRDGIFKRLCEVAESNRDKDFVIIIDEINRGNISRILGELLLLLEYRENKVCLPYSKPGDEPFSIPPNIYLIGTMNTTDRSLAQIDYALRRRFYFYRMALIVNDRAPVLERWLQKQNIPDDSRQRVLRLFINLNRRVQQELGEHYHVGHSYFMESDIATEAGQRRVWQRAVMPLLEEYFYNRRDRTTLLTEFRIESLLGDHGTAAEG